MRANNPDASNIPSFRRYDIIGSTHMHSHPTSLRCLVLRPCPPYFNRRRQTQLKYAWSGLFKLNFDSPRTEGAARCQSLLVDPCLVQSPAQNQLESTQATARLPSSCKPRGAAEATARNNTMTAEASNRHQQQSGNRGRMNPLGGGG